MRQTIRSFALGVALSSALAGLAHAEMRALLVGVSTYPTLEKNYQLLGPPNDVQRIRQTLEQRGFAGQRIAVLADGVAGAQSPTRANILRELDVLARQARSGDTIVLYFAGHGSQQPADRNTPEGRQEPDGLHEIFLPIDVGRWDGQSATVRNALIDHELRAAVDRIVARGAFVWGIFDACHSASLVRSAGDADVRYRHVNPQDLGITEKEIDAATADAARTRGGAAPDPGALGETADPAKPGRGQAVFFYAAQTTELTPEMRLPAGAPERQSYGLFSFMLARALELGQPMSYRQLGQYILAQYGGINEARVTPQFSGTALDRAVLGQQELPIRQWPVTAGQTTVPVGALSGITEGALFAVVAGPLASNDQAFGYLQARRVELDRSEVAPVAHAGKSAPATLPSDSYARLVSSPEEYTLRVALDTRGCASNCPWEPVIARLRKEGVPGSRVQWTTSGAEVILKLDPERIVALSPSEQGDIECGRGNPCSGTTRGTTLAVRGQSGKVTVDQVATDLGASLHAIARSRNLMTLATRLAEQSRKTGLAITVEYRRGEKSTRQTITPDKVPALRAGDQLIVTLENKGQKALDVTLLYADARYGISPLFPSGNGEINRLEPGARTEIDDIVISDASGVVGIERLFAISVEAERHAERADFSFLSQPSLKDVTLRSSRQSDEVTAFLDAGFADFATRGLEPRAPGRRTQMQVFTLDVRPQRAAVRP